MRRLGSWSVVLGLGLAACTVPSLEELEDERPVVLVDYTASFKKGCFVVRYLDAAKPSVELNRGEITDLSAAVPPFKVTVFREEGWPEKVQFIVTAHEQSCFGLQVDQQAVDLDLTRSGTKVTLTLVTPDADGDGFVPTANGGTDCNDESGNARPNGPPETCDGLDNDCKGGIDNGLPRSEFFRDGDLDGVGAGSAVVACTAPAGHVAASGDCDDANAARTPSRQEVCNDIDDNCNGTTDEGFSKDWYFDGDGDTYGELTQSTKSCASPGVQYVAVGGDCNDGDAFVHPGAAERCNDRDDNCVGGVDEPFLTGAEPKGGSCIVDGTSGIYVCAPDETQTVCAAPP